MNDKKFLTFNYLLKLVPDDFRWGTLLEFYVKKIKQERKDVTEQEHINLILTLWLCRLFNNDRRYLEYYLKCKFCNGIHPNKDCDFHTKCSHLLCYHKNDICIYEDHPLLKSEDIMRLLKVFGFFNMNQIPNWVDYLKNYLTLKSEPDKKYETLFLNKIKQNLEKNQEKYNKKNDIHDSTKLCFNKTSSEDIELPNDCILLEKSIEKFNIQIKHLTEALENSNIKLSKAIKLKEELISMQTKENITITPDNVSDLKNG